MTPENLRAALADLVNAAFDDGMPAEDVYGVITTVQHGVEVIYDMELVAQLRQSSAEGSA